MEKINDQQGITSRILELVDDSNMTNRRFAIAMTIDVSNFKKKIKGELPWTINDIDKICTNTNVPKEWLMNGEGERIPVSIDSEMTSKIKDDIIALARKLSENEEIILRAKRENEDIMRQLNTLYIQLDKY